MNLELAGYGSLKRTDKKWDIGDGSLVLIVLQVSSRFFFRTRVIAAIFRLEETEPDRRDVLMICVSRGHRTD